MCDGRAVRDDHSRVHLQLTEAHLPGLNDIDAQDAVVLGAYLTAFAQTLTEVGYRSEIVPVSQPAKSSGASGRTRKENAV